jgi:lipoic acid synthetase
MNNNQHLNSRRKPDWLKIRLPQSSKYSDVHKIIEDNHLHTICTSGKCPNLGECWDRGTATLMILGDICTRACKFCAVKTGKPLPLDLNEPKKIARSVKSLNLKHVVLTSVDRDDLSDGGAQIWAETVSEIKKLNPLTTIETLIPDFNGAVDLINIVINSKPEVISHNLETVKRLTPQIRSRAKYQTSLEVIKQISDSGIISKSGIMVGLGETFHEVIEVMNDLRSVNCKVLTIGQYLQPTPKHADVIDYIHPDIFKEWKKIGTEKGFDFVESSPLVRSSYHAEKHILK